ncbi:restriction endonuclease [Pseudomonas entomophila]|uniref:restriction endonuclease n=1 Tax=Pseudomonas entomophila TaxID=312306 RepID=UPI001F0297D7|nr:restriction endonuclease [Pseudomonas entomophila]MCG8291719.1 restriction endonuclease [Pseudomonas entomophila]
MDFSKIDPHIFELICAEILKLEGFTIERQQAKTRDIGVDFVVTDGLGKSWAVEVKNPKNQRMASSALQKAAAQLNAAREFADTNNGLLITSLKIEDPLKSYIQGRNGITVWDARHLDHVLSANKSATQSISNLINTLSFVGADSNPDVEAKHNLNATTVTGKEPKKFFNGVYPGRDTSGMAILETRAQELIDRLDALPPGKPTFRDYENLCIEILNYVFYPQLGVPYIQSRSEDDLDIRDAVYPISGDHPFWKEIKTTSLTRSVVAEFKNYTDPIGQKEVESLQQYLFKKAMRMFGLLCSRKQPSDSALKARRRVWMESDKLILLLSDEDLKDLVRARSYGETPTDVLDAQLDDFFLKLAP